jgi:hypothetical protein
MLDNISGCFITTAALSVFDKPDDCYELTMFGNFRDNRLIHEPEGKSIIHEYYRIAPAIIKEIKQISINQYGMIT